MAREIIWTPEAQEDYRDTVSYLIDEFGNEVATKYTQKLFDTLETLLKMPYIGRAHKNLVHYVSSLYGHTPKSAI